MKEYILRDRLDSRDAALASRLCYGVLQNRMLLDFYIAHFLNGKLRDLQPVVLDILRLGAFQLVFLDKIPTSAAVNEAVEQCKTYATRRAAGLVNGVLRGAVRSKESIVYPDAEKDPRQYLALKEFHPDWLVKRWLKQFGFEGAQALCRFDNEPPPLTLRVNTLVSDRKTLLASLQEDGFEAEPSKWCEDGIVCTKIPALSVLFSKYNDMCRTKARCW